MNNIVIKKDKLYLISDNTDIKDMKHIVMHSTNENKMKEFLKKIVDVLNSYKFKDIKDIKDLQFNYLKEPKNLFEGCDWYEMPEYKPSKDLLNSPTITIYYSDENIINNISKIINSKISLKLGYHWYPYRLKSLEAYKKLMYESPEDVKPKYPIYILSKGRWQHRYTSRYLDWSDIPYKIVIEPQEYIEYSKYIDKSKILILPEEYLNKNQGGIPARNFILKHSRDNKDKRHWILDDNIMGYYRLNDSDRTFLKGGCAFRIVEDYVDRYENIKMAGHNYKMFGVPSSVGLKPLTKNTRVYSSILLSNDIPFEWRGRYNEDTDLSLRILKAGYPTVIFNAILADKQTTLKQKGGNTDTIYNVKDALYLKAKSLQEQHPDVAFVRQRFNRIHHFVDYSSFKSNKFIFKKNIEKTLKAETNNYGMKLVEKPEKLY